MKHLGMDLGTKTLGLAISDKLGMISSPFKLIKYNNVDDLLNQLLKIIKEENIEVLVLGLPKNMDNSMGYAAERSLEFKKILENKQDLKVNLIDERLSTKEAERILININVSRQMRKKKIDGVSASIILDTYLRKEDNKNG